MFEDLGKILSNPEYMNYIWQGFGTTLIVTLIAVLIGLVLGFIVAIVKTRLLVCLVFLLRLLLCSLIVVFSGSFCTSNSIIIMYIFYHTKISCQENHKRFTKKY